MLAREASLLPQGHTASIGELAQMNEPHFQCERSVGPILATLTPCFLQWWLMMDWRVLKECSAIH